MDRHSRGATCSECGLGPGCTGGRPKCLGSPASCAHPGAVHYPEWDSYWCPTCQQWLSPVCGAKACAFCASRPEDPTQA